MVEDKFIRHIGTPDTKLERERAPSIAIADFEALYLRRALRRYAGYRDDGEGIARAYVDDIDKQVRENKQTLVNVYAHTEKAWSVLFDALDEATVHPEEIGTVIEIQLEDKYKEFEDQ